MLPKPIMRRLLLSNFNTVNAAIRKRLGRRNGSMPSKINISARAAPSVCQSIFIIYQEIIFISNRTLCLPCIFNTLKFPKMLPHPCITEDSELTARVLQTPKHKKPGSRPVSYNNTFRPIIRTAYPSTISQLPSSLINLSGFIQVLKEFTVRLQHQNIIFTIKS